MKLSIRKFLLSLTLLMPALQQTACADNVTYLYRSWDESTKTVKTETKTANATPLRNVAKNGEWMGLGDGWYYMEGERINIQTLNILGTDVHLILGDGTIFECYGGIKLEEGHKLTIYGQSEGGGAGFLWAHQGTSSAAKGYDGMAGIGGGKKAKVGDLVIHGGRIKAEGGQYAAGIGGGDNGKIAKENQIETHYQKGTITIYGGTIEANGGECGAGIGGGCIGRLESVTIYGGNIWATGGKLASGVGGGGSYHITKRNLDGNGVDGFTIKIFGGNLTAQGGKRGAGIGTGNTNITDLNRHGGYLYIYGGEVTTNGGDYGAGIGGGCNVDGATVEIHGGKVTATGGKDAAGIGGGESGCGRKLTVDGGVVRAVGTGAGAGIGGGEKTYYTRGTENKNKNERKYHNDAKGGTIIISGGTVVAIAGNECNGTWRFGGSAIGSGKGTLGFGDGYNDGADKDRPEQLGTLDIKSPMKVTAGSSESSPERVFTAGERAAACHWRNYCKVEVCNHTDADAFSYTQVGTDKHRKYCRYCEYTAEEDHTYPDNHGICECGKVFNQSTDMWTAVVYRVNSSSSTEYDGSTTLGILSSNKTWIPAPREIDGLTFMQWMQDPETVPESIEMKDDEFNPEAEQSFYLTPKSNVKLYPRYRYDYDEVWTWSDDHSSATLTLKQGDVVVKSDITATVTTEEQDATASENGYKRYTATAAWEKAPGITYQFTDVFESTYINSLTLQDDADNEDLLWENHGAQVQRVELSGRTIYRDGKWNTLVLPFDIDDLSGTDLGGLDLRTLSASSYDATTKTLKLTFTKVTKIEAGKPYIIRSEYEHAGFIELSDPTFRNVTINATDNSVQTDVVDFIGTYSPIELDASMTDVLYLGSNNTLRWPKGNTTLKSCRAVFMLKGAAAGADAAATRLLIDFGDGEVTGIETLERIPVLTGEDSNVFYTLGGRRMTGSQLPRGIYINKGKKVIIK